MKATLAAVLILAILTFNGATMAQATAAGYEGKLDQACRFQLADGHTGWSVKEVKRTISCFVRRWPVSRDKAFYIADRESGFHATAYNASGCSGVYQWSRSTWASVLNDFPPLYAVLSHNVFNARSNIAYAIKYAHNRGWAPWQ